MSLTVAFLIGFGVGQLVGVVAYIFGRHVGAQHAAAQSKKERLRVC